MLLTHSARVMLAGCVVQGGSLSDKLPWLLALPLGVSILPSILLAGCPDRAADEAAGKRTLVVRWGMARATVHAAWLWQRLRRRSRQTMSGRIDGLIVMALSFMLWFCVPLLLVLMRAAPG